MPTTPSARADGYTQSLSRKLMPPSRSSLPLLKAPPLPLSSSSPRLLSSPPLPLPLVLPFQSFFFRSSVFEGGRSQEERAKGAITSPPCASHRTPPPLSPPVLTSLPRTHRAVLSLFPLSSAHRACGPHLCLGENVFVDTQSPDLVSFDPASSQSTSKVKTDSLPKKKLHTQAGEKQKVCVGLERRKEKREKRFSPW